jgi:hypothetical protein
MNTKFGLGRVLATGFRIWVKNFVPLFVLTAVTHLPLILWAVVLTVGRLDYEQMRSMATFEMASVYLAGLLNMIASGLAAYGVVMQLRGKRTSIFACLASGERLFPMLGAMILPGLAVIGAFLCSAVPWAILIAAVPGLLVGVATAGGICSSLVALYVHAMLYVAVPAAALEPTSVRGTLSRSRALTRGHRIRIAVLTVLVLAIAFALAAALSFMNWGASFSALRYRLWVYLDLVRSVLIGSFHATLAGVVYYYLCAEKEGTSAVELVEIFD